jgi:hypothetical protein
VVPNSIGFSDLSAFRQPAVKTSAAASRILSPGSLSEKESDMRRLLQCLIVAGSAVGLSACYDFQAPLDATPQVLVDPALIGEWRCIVSDPDPYPAEDGGTLVFTALSNRTYGIETKPSVSPEKTSDNQLETFAPLPDGRAAFTSTLDGATILNVPSGNDTPRWMLIRYSYLRPNVLHLELVREDYGGSAATPSELRAALLRPDAASGAYEDLLYCVRVRPEK